MYEYKKGFTMVEVLLVVVLMIAIFSMSLSVLKSFSSPKYIEKDFAKVKGILSEIKYLKIANEKNISIGCDTQKMTLYLEGQVVDEKQLDDLTCKKQTSIDPFLLDLSNGSTTFEVRVNKYGYVSIQRI